MFMDETKECKKAIDAYLDQFDDQFDFHSNPFVLPVMTLSALLSNVDNLLTRYLLKENESTLANITYLLALTNELAKLVTKIEKIGLELVNCLQNTAALTTAAQQKLTAILACTEICLNRIFTVIHMDEKHIEFTVHPSCLIRTNTSSHS